MTSALASPLRGIGIVEFEGLGPGPLAGRILADMGADITLIVRPGAASTTEKDDTDLLRRGKRVETLDLKSPDGRARARALVEEADGLIEGFRPGVMERLGLGPSDFASGNPHLVYGRITGWGQDGPLAQTAGHDLNYVALTGLLPLSSRDGAAPIVPPTIVGDASGALGLAFGMVAALLDVGRGASGRVVDAAIVDIVAMLGTLVQWLKANGQLAAGRPSAFHDSPFYDVYPCADGFITVGALEPQFYALLLERLGLTDVDPAAQYDTAQWPALKARMAALFAGRTRAEWSLLLEGGDVCFAPVLNHDEAARHPHIVSRRACASDGNGVVRPLAAPRFRPLDDNAPKDILGPQSHDSD
ncbi:CaiB/BaiF CoA transferase family protein [Pseudochelatococcus sp. B33]